MTHTPELKPCPFCGSDAELVQRDNPMSKWRWSVDCNSTTCGVSGPVEALRQDAIAAWNTRTEAGVVRELVEAGQQALDALHSARDTMRMKFGTTNPHRETAIEELTAALAKAGAA